ncbi:MAG TPA: hypothetical protein VG456_00105 [Candidatus Sulfopaludibacter sp.]|jgi:hypothetical protein|nr:hypothetical protein [Candidatus Sulfopaludibacter sp.]
MTKSRLFLLSSALLALCIPGSASTIGTFNMSGIITVTSTDITWQTDAAGHAADMFTLSGGTDLYSTEDGQNGIANLNDATEPVGSTFGPFPFITFEVDPSVPNLLINFIKPGIYTSADCFTTPAATGQTCTLPGSPFSFVNDSPTSSTASWTFSGVTADGNNWSAIFTSQFATESYQDVLAGLASGSVTSTYSAAEVTVSGPSSVPEPGPLSTVTLGAGLLALSLSIKKFRRS